MTEAELDLIAAEVEEREAFDTWAEQFEAPPEDDMPAECARCGNPFGGAAVKVGNRWICTADEEAEYKDYDAARGEWITAMAAHLDKNLDAEEQW